MIGYLIAISSMAMNCDKEAININPDILDRLEQANMVAPPPMPPDMMVDFDFQTVPSATLPKNAVQQHVLIDLAEDEDVAGPSGVEQAGAGRLPMPPQQEQLWAELMERAAHSNKEVVTDYAVVSSSERRMSGLTPAMKRGLEVATDAHEKGYKIRDTFMFGSQLKFLEAIGHTTSAHKVSFNPKIRWEKAIIKHWK